MRLIGLAVILTVSFILAPLATAAAQAGKVYRVGFVLSGGPTPNPTGPNPGLLEFDAFVHRMRELGYVLGQNLPPPSAPGSLFDVNGQEYVEA